jgi:hypothetical protein
MTGDDERRDATPERASGGERSGERDARGAAEREPQVVPAPTPEEAPELLGEQSDYPIAWEPSADDERDR